MRSQSAQARRARYLSSAAYARSRAVYAARLEDRLYWLKCAQSWEHHAAALPDAEPASPLFEGPIEGWATA